MSRISCLALAIAALAVPLGAGAQVSVNINVPGLITVEPPAPRYEPMPGPRGGQVWVPGHWQWAGNAYAWRGGYWQPAREGYDWAPGRWVPADGGWRWVEGGWRQGRRDRDWEGRRDWERDHERWERRHGRDRDDDDQGRYHCPPGQAKKGNC